ncbi:MAG: hypothetical protein IKS98_07110 [Lachnospiraceae bacterium]|nr:hypothetical protein [Lachnospiraceae bacterium]
MRIELTDKNVKLIGRSMLFDDTLLLSLSGSGIEFEYTGKAFDITFIGGVAAASENNDVNYARIAIYVDGMIIKDFLLNQQELTVHMGDAILPGRESSVIRVLKLSECAMSLVGIKPLEVSEGDTVKPTPDKSLKIEFIGDSITCGYGVEDPDPLHDFKTGTENVTRAFAYKTAKALDADHSMFSISGYGIISGYTPDPAERHADQLIPDFYESMGLSYDKLEGIPKSQDIKWDFTKYVPDIVVLNLGTNDDSYCQDDKERQAWYASEYIKFLKTVRKYNEKAYIVCAFGLMGDRLYPTICDAVKTYSESTGDCRITTVHLPEQDPKAGYGANYHPLESEHEKAANVLIKALKELIKGKIYCIMGKSSSGKDTIYKKILEKTGDRFKTIVSYTTRPIRDGETDGVEYHFVTVPGFEKMRDEDKVIEYRCYHTIHGDWYYFTADDGQIDLYENDYLLIMTPEGYKNLQKYFGKDRVLPIYIDVETGLRLSRAVERERKQHSPKYAELCRRFLADEEDFSDDKLEELGINKRYLNVDLEETTNEIINDL